jgi:hypothetical protein
VPADKLVGTIVAERAFDMICLLILMVITIVTQTGLIGDFIFSTATKNVGSKAQSLSATKIVIAIAVLLILGGLAIYIFKKFAHIGFIAKIRKIIMGIWQGLTSVRFVKHKGWFIFHSIFIWSMYLASVQIGMWSLQETEAFGIKPSMSVLFMGSIAMIITPSGIGAYPLLVMQTMALYGLGEAYGKAFGWVLWTVQFFQILIFGLIAVLLLPYLNKKKENAQS